MQSLTETQQGRLVLPLTRVCVLLCCSLTMGQLYDKEKDEDGFLYVAYSGENTFGFRASRSKCD